MQLFQPDFKSSEYFIATYFLASSKNLREAAWDLAIGQSVGNPSMRSIWETEQLFQDHSIIILADEQELKGKLAGTVSFAFPLRNIDLQHDGVSQLLCQLMGGQMDIGHIGRCHLNDIEFPPHIIEKHFPGPRFGLSGTRAITNTWDKPLLGGIVKPKVANDVEVLKKIVTEMVEGGVNFIKEDEIMANPASCPLDVRVREISKIIDQTNVVYCYCINGDSIADRAKQVYELGGRGVHVNFWSGLGSYRNIRQLPYPLFIHFQKSGDRILTNPNHNYHIKWDVICKLAGLMGVDSIHAGMIGGYMSSDTEDTKETLKVLHKHNVIPALSCGMHPGLIENINSLIGVDYMANVGGALHGHPMGTKAGAMAMRQSIDKQYSTEYNVAIEKWGKII